MKRTFVALFCAFACAILSAADAPVTKLLNGKDLDAFTVFMKDSGNADPDKQRKEVGPLKSVPKWRFSGLPSRICPKPGFWPSSTRNPLILRLLPALSGFPAVFGGMAGSLRA